MRGVTGSRFWGCELDTSDTDVLEVVFPTKVDLYYGRKKDGAQKYFNGEDVIIKDVRSLMEGLRKGVLKYYEFINSAEVDGAIDSDELSLFYALAENMDNLFYMNEDALRIRLAKELRARLKKENKTREELAKTVYHCMKLVLLLETEDSKQLANSFNQGHPAHKRISKVLKRLREDLKDASEESYDSYISMFQDFVEMCSSVYELNIEEDNLFMDDFDEYVADLIFKQKLDFM